MTPENLSNATRTLAAEQDEYVNLNICDQLTEHGNKMVSVWKLSAAEVEAIQNGGHVVLVIAGNTHPPVMLNVQNAAGKPVEDGLTQIAPVTVDAFKLPRTREGWYFGTSDDESPMFGPFDTEAAARHAFWLDYGADIYTEQRDEDPDFDPDITPTVFKDEWEHVYQMGVGPIDCRAFDADFVLETWVDQNEEHVWDRFPPAWTSYQKRDLENMLAQTLVQWGLKHNATKQFRGLS